LTIERDRSLPAGELINRIQSAVARYVVRLPQLSPADWDKRGLHSRLGEMTVEVMLPRFVVGHLEEHAAQLTDTLAEPAPGTQASERLPGCDGHGNEASSRVADRFRP
jgi:hypothetical protein